MSSSPFEIFRRNLKPLMVLLTGLALFAFVVLPVMDTYMRQNNGGAADGVVASFDGIDLNQRRVENFTQNHQSTVRFLYDLAQKTIDREGMPQTAGFQLDPNSGQIRAIGINEAPSFDGTIRSFMLASEAQKLGFDLDDSALQVWLTGFTDGLIPSGEIDALLMKQTQNTMGRPHLYEQLRIHLLSNVFLTRGFSGLSLGSGPFARNLLTPEEEWSNFLKLNQNAVVKAYGVQVNDYAQQANSTPSEEEVLEVYEEGKNRFPNPQSPEPGFKERYSAKFEYVVASRQKFLAEEAAKIPEETLRAEYEKRLAGGQFKLPDMPIIAPEGPDSEENPATETPSTENPTAEGTTETPAAEGTTETTGEESNDPAPTTESEGTEPPAAESSESTNETEEEAGTDDSSTSESTESGEETEPPASDGPSSDGQACVIVDAVKLVAMQETSEAQNESQSGETEAAAEPATTDPQAETEAAAETTSNQEAESNEASGSDESSESATATDGDESAEAESTETETPDAEPPSEPKVESFEDVRQQIAEDLARPAADKRINAAMIDVMNQMAKYGKRLRIDGENSDLQKPNLKELAEKYGLEYESIGPFNELDLIDLQEPIAESSEMGIQFGGLGPSFRMTMYGFQSQQSAQPPQRLWAPIRTADVATQKEYVSWKVEETEAYVPSLEDAREAVLEAIQKRDARKFAEEAAEKVAKEVSDGKALADVVPTDRADQIIEDVAPFTWMRSFGFQGASIASVEKLDDVGEDFMKGVFAAKPGDVVVVPNNPKTVFYVVKTTQFQPSTEELRQQFTQQSNRLMAMLMGNGNNKVITDFYKRTDEDAGFVNYLGQSEE